MLLDVQNLSITFDTQAGPLKAVREISFSIEKGETLGIVGESGCGKSITSLALMGLLPETAHVSADQLNFAYSPLLSLKEKQWQKIRGAEIGMIFQDPMSALNPCFNVEQQLMETLLIHKNLTRAEARERSIELLDQVGIPAPKERLKAYPHELSGGMSQRVMIAMAIACNPSLLIADEPTTALDVTIQDQILKLLKKLQKQNNMAMILVTHDLAVVANHSDQIQVMYAGEIVEKGITREIIEYPRHPYTYGLLNSLPATGHAFREPLPSITGIVPDLFSRSPGCQFRPRCFKAQKKCQENPPLELGQGRELRCYLPIEEKE